MEFLVLDDDGPQCRIWTVGDFASKPLDLSHLPEFAFSPRIEWFGGPGLARILNPPAPPPARVIGPMPPPVISNPRKPHDPEVTGPAEATWRSGELVWPAKPIKAHTKPPVGTVPPYEQELRDADADLQHLIDTQCCSYHANGGHNFAHAGRILDLPTVGQELAQLSLPSVNLSKSSSEDDDDTLDSIIADERAEEDAVRYGVPYLTAELAPKAQRIEWERFAYHCGPVQRFWLTMSKGQLVPASTEPVIPPSIVQHLVKIAGLLDGRTVDELNADRWFAQKHYRAIGSFLYGAWKGQHPTTTYVSDESITNDDGGNIGPRELGLHEVEDVELLTESEPPEAILWPVSLNEIVFNLQHEITLSAIETRWLYHPMQEQELRSLRGAGFPV